MTLSAATREAIDMIRQSAAGVADRRDLMRVRRLRYTSPGFDRAIWTEICALGWPALRVPEARGGIGLGLTAYCALAEELGAALTPEPLIEASLCAALVDDEALEPLLSGTQLILPAWQDEGDALGPTLDLAEADGKLDGHKLHVPMACGADAFLMIGRQRSWLVAANDPGVALDAHETQDGGHVARLSLSGAAARAIDADPTGALAEACLATSAYLLGMIDAALERTNDYLHTRVQFGQKIGTFQALQHRMVDLKLQAELTRASIADAAQRWDAAPLAAASLAAISRAKLRASQAAMLVSRQAIQLHGGIGFTEEHDISLFLRKAMTLAPRFGSAGLHSARYAHLLPPESY